MKGSQRFDFVILGAGAGGIAAAKGLAERFPRSSVALVEEGRDYPSGLPLLQRVPLFHLLQSSSRRRTSPAHVLRKYISAEEGCLNQRRLGSFAGRGVGGSVLVNDMKAVRPTQLDCQSWGEGWSWEAFSPFLRQSIRCSGDDDACAAMAAVHHGDRSSVHSALNIRFYEACEAAGIPAASSFNQSTADGYSFYESLIRRGCRQQLLHSSLLPANVKLLTETKADHLVLEGKRAVGVSCHATGSRSSSFTLSAGKLVVTMGAIESPLFLLRSGLENPAIGSNLIASPTIATQFSMQTDPGSVGMSLKGTQLLHPITAWRQWKAYRDGDGGDTTFSTLSEAGVFLRSTNEAPQCDVSVDFFRHALPPWCVGEASGVRRLMDSQALTLRATYHYPQSRGKVSMDPEHKDRSRITFGLLSDGAGEDIQRVDEALQWVSRLMAPRLPSVYYINEHHEPVSPFYLLKIRMSYPPRSLQSETEVAEFVRANAVPSSSLYGTCAMGSVVDPKTLSVLGVDNVLVGDCSVIPQPTVASSFIVSAGVGARVASLLEA